MENVPATTLDSASQLPATQSAPARSTPALTGANDLNSPLAGVRLPAFLQGLSSLNLVRQVGLVLALAAAIALGVGMVFWTQGTQYKPLIAADSQADSRAIIEVLQSNRVNFHIDPVSGMVLVAEKDLHKARLALATVDLNANLPMGYELLDGQSALGTSQFMENARYRRSIEGELARTITSIQQVRSARVHLAIPERTVFIRDRRHPSASVFVDVQPGQSLAEDQVKAIASLVARSIPEMQSEYVSVVDQRGRLLSDYSDKNEAQLLTEQQLDYQRQVEDRLLTRVNNILGPVIGSGFQAQISTDIDFTKVEQAEELFNPDLIALRSEQLLNEERVNQPAGGIPGALNNQPPGNAEAPEIAGQGNGDQGVPVNRRNESTRNYEVDRTLSFTQFAQGRINRLTVAVVVDDVMDPGAQASRPWTEQELDALKRLVRDAVGFNAARGDSIEVVNAAFRAQAIEFEDAPFYTQPWFWDIMKQVLIGLFLLILVFGVLKPAFKRISDVGKPDEDSDSLDALQFDEDAISDDKVTLSLGEEYLLPGPSDGYERQLDALRGLIAEDPGRVALVMKHWIMSDD